MMLLRHHAALHLFNDQAEAITVLQVWGFCWFIFPVEYLLVVKIRHNR